MTGNRDDIFDLGGQVAIVTGGGTGIGRATALVLSGYGATVVLASRRVADLKRVGAEITSAGGTAMALETDVCDPGACESLIADTVAEFGGLDILVNNAGGSRSRTDAEWTGDDWKRMLDLNLRSVWLLSRGAATAMAQRGGGAIVNVASAAALTPRPIHAPYGVAKAGVIHLTSVLAAEFGPAGIRVNCVAPGLVKSEGFVRATRAIGRDPDAQGDRVLVGRPGDPEEVAYPILFLVSQAASYIHGETLYVGGGPRYWSPQ